MRQPVKIALTGGIGSGKSVVSRLFRLMGVPVYDCDTESKRLTATDPEIRRRLTALLGADVYAAGRLNKPFLAGYLFSSDEHVAQVNAIIHPQVCRDFAAWVERHAACPVVAVESAILFESCFRNEVDASVMVYAPIEVRKRRVMLRDAATQAAVEQRMGRQMSDEEKRDLCDYLILNDGDTPLIPQVQHLLGQLSVR